MIMNRNAIIVMTRSARPDGKPIWKSNGELAVCDPLLDALKDISAERAESKKKEVTVISMVKISNNTYAIDQSK